MRNRLVISALISYIFAGDKNNLIIVGIFNRSVGDGIHQNALQMFALCVLVETCQDKGGIGKTTR